MKIDLDTKFIFFSWTTSWKIRNLRHESRHAAHGHKVCLSKYHLPLRVSILWFWGKQFPSVSVFFVDKSRYIYVSLFMKDGKYSYHIFGIQHPNIYVRRTSGTSWERHKSEGQNSIEEFFPSSSSFTFVKLFFYDGVKLESKEE